MNPTLSVLLPEMMKLKFTASGNQELGIVGEKDSGFRGFGITKNKIINTNANQRLENVRNYLDRIEMSEKSSTTYKASAQFGQVITKIGLFMIISLLTIIQ